MNTDTLELKSFKRIRLLGREGLHAIIKYARILLNEDDRKDGCSRYYWFDQIDERKWNGGWDHTIDACLGPCDSIYVVDRFTGRIWDIQNVKVEGN